MSRILIMEDDIPLALELATKLEVAGHDVTVAHNATSARDELWHWDFDLLITDIIVRRDGRIVPDGGLGLISWVRHTATTTRNIAYLPVIAVSGAHLTRGMEFLLPTANRIGADSVLEKPLNMPTLLAEIKRLTYVCNV